MRERVDMRERVCEKKRALSVLDLSHPPTTSFFLSGDLRMAKDMKEKVMIAWPLLSPGSVSRQLLSSPSLLLSGAVHDKVGSEINR